MKLFIYIYKFIIFTLYLLPLIPYFSTIIIINIFTKLLQNKPDIIIKCNTHFIYFTCNILLRNHTNKFLIYFILNLQNIIFNFGIDTGLILCRTQSIHKGQGILLKFQAYPQPLLFTNIYFAIWFTLIQETKFLNNDTTQIFICTRFSSILWDSEKKSEVGDYKPGLCNLISDVKTPLAIRVGEWCTLHSNFTWDSRITIIDYIRAIIAYHQTLINTSNASAIETYWINEVHVTSWKVSNHLNNALIKRYDNNNNKNFNDKKFDNKNIMR
jgi:hypothetical protein